MRKVESISEMFSYNNIFRKRNKLIYIIYFFIAILFFFSNCKDGSEDSSPVTSGFTNAADQEYMLLSNEFDKRNYIRVIEFADNFFNKNSLDKDNVKILLLEVEAKEKFLRELNRKSRKSRWETAKKCGFKIIKDKIFYDYKELKKIGEELSDTEYCMDAFYKYIEKITDRKEKINSYTEFTDNIKDKKIKNRLRFELSDIYSQNLNDLKRKEAKELNKLYIKLLTTEYKDKVIINSVILEYKITGKRDYYKKEITALLNEKNSNGMLANYLMGELEFINTDYDTSENYFNKAKKMFKHVGKEDKIPLLLSTLEYFPGSSLENLKNIINRKIKLIERLIKYQNILKEKKIALITGERVRVRTGPVILKRNIISTLNYGDKVIIVKRSDKKEKLENEENYWYKIELIDNTTGWVFGKYLLFFIY